MSSEEKEGYPQVIEWEYINDITVSNSELSVAMVFYFNDIISKDTRFNKLYEFEVIPYGYIGFYAATGVKFINGNKTELDYDYIQSEYLDTLKNLKLGDFIDFAIENRVKIREFFKTVDKRNQDLFDNGYPGFYIQES